MTILVKIFGKSQFLKISISVKILGILDLSSKNLDFAQNFQIIEFCHNFRKSFRFLSKFSKILILVKIFKILDFGQNFRKCSFWSKFSENIYFR